MRQRTQPMQEQPQAQPDSTIPLEQSLTPTSPPILWKQPTTMGVYGETATGKTYQLCLLISYLLKKWGWKPGDPPIIRVVSWDSTSDPYLEFMQAGAVQFLPALAIRDGNGQPVIAQVLQTLARGHWRIILPGVEPTTHLWNGKETEPSVSLLKKYPQLKGKKIPSGLPQDNGIRAYLIEGVSEMADLLLKEHGVKTRGLSDEKGNAMKFQVESLVGSDVLFGMEESLVSGSPTRNHYQMVFQDVLQSFIKTGIAALPLDLVFVSMHQAKGVSEYQEGTPALGPDIPGQKGVGKVIQKFGHFLHLQTLVQRDKPVEYRAYYEPHFGAPGTPLMQMVWPAKLSLAPGKVGLFRKKYPNGIPLDLNPTGSTNTVADVLEFAWTD